MAHLPPRKNRPELVSPAGNLEKLRFAVRFGAGAVYFGGERFNLRAGSDNFSLEDIAQALDFCRAAACAPYSSSTRFFTRVISPKRGTILLK